jgi:HEAT repeat protein
LDELGSSDSKVVGAVASNPGGLPISPTIEAKLRDLESNHPNILVRQAALRSLLNGLKDDALADKAWTMPSYNEGFRNAAMFYYVKNDKDKARELALGVLANPDSEALRQTCIQVLGDLKDKPNDRRVFNALVKVVEERSFGARNAAMSALGNYGDKAALPYLKPLVTNSMVFTRRTAQGAVKQLGG